MRFKLNNSYLEGQFTVGEVVYPWNWLTLASAEELMALGIITEPDAVPVAPTLDELKVAKRREINRARDQAEAGGFSYLGYTFDSDMRSAQRISIAAQAAGLDAGFYIAWTTSDNQIAGLNQQQMVGMPAALANHAYLVHGKAYTLKATLDAATTADQVAAIVW